MFSDYYSLFIPQIILQIACILHVLRKGKDRIWIYVIAFLPLVGCIAYLIAELLPSMRSRKIIINANEQVGNALFPARRIKALEEQIELVDTYQNRMLLGEAYAANQRYEEAINLFTKSLQGIYKDDIEALSKRGLAYYASGNMALAKADFEQVIGTRNLLGEKEQLIYAITLENLNETSAAIKAYNRAMFVATGLEADYRYAMLMKKEDKDEEAIEIFENMLRKAKQSPSYFRSREAKWMKLAKDELSSVTV